MNDIRRVKSLITKLNKQCDLENKSIFSILENKSINPIEFFASLGLDTSMLNSILSSVLDNLIRTPDTRIYFNPSMQSLENDEIEIYSPSLKMYLGFLQDKVKALVDKATEDETYQYTDMEYMAVLKTPEDIQTIHFSTSVVSQAQKHLITQNDPLDKVDFKVKYSSLKTPEKKIKVTIKKDMLESDLNNIYRVLYSFNFSLAYALLYFYPTTLKIIDTEFEMNNFNNR